MGEVLLALVVGLAIGLPVGALGGGGSVLAVPVLVHVFGEEPYAATTASLVVVGVAALAGLAGHARAGEVRWRTGAVFGVLGVVGTLVGSRLSAAADPQLLLLGFGVLLVAAAAVMLLRQRGGTGDSAVGRALACPLWSRCWQLRVLRTVLAASAVGLMTGLFGVGGGFLVVPALTLALGLPMSAAVGTSLLVIVVNASAGLVARVGAELDVAVVVPFTVAAVVGALVGEKTARRLPERRLTQAFAALLVLVGLGVGADAALSLVG